MAQPQAKFLTGSTMRHVAVMTLTSSLGLSFMFLIDAATLFWIGQLNDETLMAAAGFGGSVAFLFIAIGIGLMIAASVLIARALGAGEREEARRLAASSMALAFGFQVVMALVAVLFREPILRLFGAQGEALEQASTFLLISMPSLPLMAMAMVAAGILRSLGDAWPAMLVTVAAGLVAMGLDPLLIVWLDWGIPGAAVVVVLARLAMLSLGLWYVIRKHDLLARPEFAHIRRMFPSFRRIAGPAILTQMATPVGMLLVTSVIASHGDGAVAGWSVVGRMTALAFGGIFALSGAVGGIIGQNAGARMWDRVETTYRDSLIFAAGYTTVTWALLFALTGPIIAAFGLGGEGAEVLRAFTHFSAGAFAFTGALFVSNAAFNNLGKPLWSTGFNWLRDAIMMWPLAWAGANLLGAAGAVYGQAAAGVIVGTFAAVTGWRYVHSLKGDGGLPVTIPAARPT